MNDGAVTAASVGLVSCEACQLLSRPASRHEPGFCRRCGEKLEFRREKSIENTWALVIAAAICYIPANALPVFTTTTLGEEEPDTILERRGVPLHVGVVAARAHRADRERDDPARQARRRSPTC